MLKLKRAEENPIISPIPEHDWEAKASYNPCVIYDNGVYHMLYRALSPKKKFQEVETELSTIGYASSTDGINFESRRQFIIPEYEWERFGCEDPRITKVDDTYFIFYTALSTFPFSAPGIKVGVATTKDFITIESKHLVTPFNAKAMTFFPEKVNGKYAALLTVDTDQPPAKISLAYFDKIEEVWDPVYWENWYSYLGDHTLTLRRNAEDHVEIGAPPLKTEQGWLLIYSYIKNYFSEAKLFSIEAATLQLNNPLLIVSRTHESLLTPEEPYEQIGIVTNVVFPSGAVIRDEMLLVYYGGADTVSCLASCNFAALLREEIREKQPEADLTTEIGTVMFKRFEENPILRPIQEHEWERMAVFNPAAFYHSGNIHLLYRASSEMNISSIGYARSSDGYHIDKRLAEPVYVAKEAIETNTTGKNYGCEDPRLTLLEDRVYMCYTAYDGQHPPQVALTSIALADFLQEQWHWEVPIRISPPGQDDKDACLFPKKINNKYIFLHRLEGGIWIDSVPDLLFHEGRSIAGSLLVSPRSDKWDSQKIGIAAPPLETRNGWLLLYHGVDKDSRYNVGVILMDLENPSKITARLDYPVFVPETEYEKYGVVPNVVFPCGAAIEGDKILMYYGGADKVVGVASLSLTQLLDELLRYKI